MKRLIMFIRKCATTCLLALLSFAPAAWADIVVHSTDYTQFHPNEPTPHAPLADTPLPGVLTCSMAFTIPVAAGDHGMLIATIGGEARAPSCTMVWDSGGIQTPMIQAVARVAPNPEGGNMTFGVTAYIFYLPNPATGPGRIRATFTPSVQRVAMGALYATGVGDLEATTVKFNGGTSDLTTDSINCSPGALLVDSAGITRTKADLTSGIQAAGVVEIFRHPKLSAREAADLDPFGVVSGHSN